MLKPGARTLRTIIIIAASIATLTGCRRTAHTPAPLIKQMSALHPQATFTLKSHPDWMAVDSDSVWVTSSGTNTVTQMRGSDNQLGISVSVDNPCSGLAIGFGSLWIPSCGKHTLVRTDLITGNVQAIIPIAPADDEGGIAIGAGSVWLMTDKSGHLSRIDPTSNTVIATIQIPAGSFCPIFDDNFVWITSTDNNILTKVDPSTNQAILQIPVGKKPRFLTFGADSIWTLNQGEGTITRISTKTNQKIADIPANLPGHGGEIAFGFGSVWATMPNKPITRIDAITSTITSQWIGVGGDSIRTGLGSVWLTDYNNGKIWRLSPDSL
jgi:virginiamycin B lyase